MSAQIAAHTAKLVRTEGAGELIDELIKVALREVRLPPLQVAHWSKGADVASLPPPVPTCLPHSSDRPRPRQDLQHSPQDPPGESFRRLLMPQTRFLTLVFDLSLLLTPLPLLPS
jgi:hypothetical protein